MMISKILSAGSNSELYGTGFDRECPEIHALMVNHLSHRSWHLFALSPAWLTNFNASSSRDSVDGVTSSVFGKRKRMSLFLSRREDERFARRLG